MSDEVVADSRYASVRLPTGSTVQQSLPNLLAKLDGRMLGIQSDVDKTTWDAYEAMLNQDLPVTPSIPGVPDIELRVVRLIELCAPYPGIQRITEQLVKSNGSCTYQWDVLLRHKGRRAVLTVHGNGAADADLDLWDQVVASFRFK